MDRLTKTLLAAIALGIWVCAAMLFLVVMQLGDIANNLDLVPQWIINGGGK